VIGGYPAGA